MLPSDLALSRPLLSSTTPSLAGPRAPRSTVTSAARPPDDSPEQAFDALFGRAQKGDVRALDALVAQARPLLFRVAVSVVRDRTIADDIAQEALVRALTRRFTFLARGPVIAWMKKIAFHLALNHRRDALRRREILHAQVGKPVAMADAPFGESAERTLVDDEQRVALLAAIDALPERQRQVLSLRVVGELSFAEIAKLLSISEANARVASSEAMKRVRVSLSAVGARGGTP